MSQSTQATQLPIQSYAQLQNYMNGMITHYGTSIASAPHKAFWNVLTYEQFVTGHVPIKNHPCITILKVGDGENSNIVQALQGVGPLFGPSGSIGQMPADGTGPWTAAEIQPLIDWIDAGCQNPDDSAISGNQN